MADAASSPYLVMARKYRPTSFETFIGQDAMVRTLSNAFAQNRIHHAYILTGVRGVGKTTTARILARAFNYEDDAGPRPTLDLREEGVHCRAIIEGRHVDVLEMDAASNTGIGDIREIIDSVRYGPVSAPNKVYIIDEVHMLSTAAFNGLLKTLEEPPPYVKFIFATTEIRKVPVTILSRCQRFNLGRVPPDTMTEYLKGLLEAEAVSAEPEALAMIVRAGEGSVRDNLSLLDQAIAHGAGAVTAETVKAMLGLGDRARVIDLFEALMAGRIAEALDALRALYDAGADPQTVIADLASFTHLVTRIKVVPATAEDVSLTPDERARGADLAGRLGMRVLSRTWQILFQGHEEVSRAGNGMQAAEMVLVRLAHAADLPSPDEVIARLSGQPGPAPSSGPPASSPGGGGHSRALRAEPVSAPAPAPAGPVLKSYAELVALAGEKRDLLLKHALETDLRPVGFSEGRIEVGLRDGADPGIVATLSARLRDWTGKTWLVTVPSAPVDTPTLRELARGAEDAARDAAGADPLVKAIFETFPGAKLVNVKVRETGFPDLPPDPEEDDP